VAINVTSVAASWPRGWHMNTAVNILPLSRVGANLEPVLDDCSF
jgi:hypothetical protein